MDAEPVDGDTMGDSITLRNHMNPQVLYHLYWRKGWSTSRIGEEFQVTSHAVQNQMQKHEIETRGQGRRAHDVEAQDS